MPSGNFRFVLTIAISFAFSDVPVQAELLVDATGIVLMDRNEGIDPISIINASGSFSGRFYGNTVGAITVSENGNLNFAGDNDYFPVPLSAVPQLARIAPLWDDVMLDSRINNAVIDHSRPGEYLGITWKNVRLAFDAPGGDPLTPSNRSFQVLWFEAPTTIRGVLFQPNEIVFSYVGAVPGTSNFGMLFSTVGITDGASRFTSLPGDADGYIESLTNGTSPDDPSNLLAWQPGSFLRFRPVDDGTGVRYVASHESVTAIPEPSTWCVGCVLTLSMVVRQAYRRKQRCFAVEVPPR